MDGAEHKLFPTDVRDLESEPRPVYVRWRHTPKSLTIRIEPHPKGEVYTFDRLEANGRMTSVSSILYLDGKSRDFRDFGCSGTQSSRRVDSRTVEILRTCANGEWTLSIRRLSAAPQELVLEITEQQPDGRRFERRLILDKQVLEKE